MKIRNKILIYFSSTVILLSGISLVIIFILFSEHREEAFQQQQLSKIEYTVGLVDKFNKMSAEVSRLLDKQDIHDFYDEKMLIYDKDKKLIFSSIDSLDISKSDAILNKLAVNNPWIETKEDGYDLIGVYLQKDAKGYHAISKAYDYFGYSKRDFLQKVLIGIFVAIVIIVLVLSFYLSNIISKPIWQLTGQIADYDFSDDKSKALKIKTTTSELQNLSEKFNELIKRTNEAFIFQKHSIQHISHELKTPIAILVTELEKLHSTQDIEQLKLGIFIQAQKAKSLGNIINVLLQIAKIEAGQDITKNTLRIDDVIFDCISEINSLFPQFNFELNFKPNNFDESILTKQANEYLIKQAFLNLLTNTVQYSDNQKAKINFSVIGNDLSIQISNSGETIAEEEQKFLFSHFFRGQNSQNKQGFGLGLALSERIFSMHNAKINYQVQNAENTFVINWN